MRYLSHKLISEPKNRHLLCTLLSLFSLTLILAGCTATKAPELKPLIFPGPPDEPRFIYERTFFSSADVETISKSDRFRQFATGASKKSLGFVKPYAVAVHRGRIYVTDTQQRTITMFDVPGRRYKTFGNRGSVRLAKPAGIDISEAGEIFVVDVGTRTVVVFDLEGNYLRNIGNKESLQRPVGVAVNNEGTRLYVVDNGGVREKEKHHVVIFDAQSGEQLKVIGKRGRKEGEFNLPLLASMDDQGTLYVVDGGNFRVQSFTAEGDFKKSFGQQGRYLGDFNRPKGIATDPDGNVYVMDTLLAHLLLFNPEGELLMIMGNYGNQSAPAKYKIAADVEVDEDGRIYVVDQIFRKVDVFRPYAMKANEGYLGATMMEDRTLKVNPPTKHQPDEPSETAEEAVEVVE